MRVLVTGARGYVGRAVLAALEAASYEPVTFTGDLVEADSLVEATRGVDAVCHLGGLTRARESWTRGLDFFQVNVIGTVNLLSAMAGNGVRRLVFASTGAIYGSPATQPMPEDLPDDVPHPYAASKRAAELAIESQAGSGQLGAAILRLFNVAGGNDRDPTRIVPRVLAVAAGTSAHVIVNGDGSAVRDLLHVTDAAAAFVAAFDHLPAPGDARRFNIGSGTGSSVMDIVRTAEQVTGRPIPVVHQPPADEPPVLIADPTRAITELAWKPQRSSLTDIVTDAWGRSRLAVLAGWCSS